MLEKNQFLIFNHVLSELYRCRTYQDLGDAFLPMLRMLIPYRYASIMRRAEAGPSIHLVDPLCVPAALPRPSAGTCALPPTTTPPG